MKVFIEKNYDQLSRRAADMIAGEINKKPNSVLCLPTGSTPIGTYRELAGMYAAGKADFSGIVTFNLDEYIGLRQDDKNSYHYFMHHHLFDHINIKPENVYIPDGLSENMEEACKNYDAKLDIYKEKDLLLTGIGQNGHIGFNEPSDRLFARTHTVLLSENTRAANSRLFENADDVPKAAITMGIADIMHFKKMIIIANGTAKAAIIKDLLTGRMVDTHNTSSLTYLHNDVTVILDEEAASLL